MKICQYRCKDAETCRAFRDYVKTHPTETVVKGPDMASLLQADMLSPRAA
ncbi:MAG: hypothetical protein KAV83_05070 [Desulfobacterales bacterium]|nr:hypothetical protein [Desulfobacterales bacterium]